MGTIAASAAFRFADRGIAVIGPVPGGLPSIGPPDVTWSETLAVLPVAASCFVMIIAQSAATSRVFAARYRERVDENADILGLAAANAAAAVTTNATDIMANTAPSTARRRPTLGFAGCARATLMSTPFDCATGAPDTGSGPVSPLFPTPAPLVTAQGG